ncbi:XRE family transcriptional regulator [Chimaeribacter californicus]|uniref:XRE family transcriptional regulator n=1 Tax=Chimaeribacter californicus TaxID=2060067 RepID=A0A2N5EEB1_9GAMM|nr:helix-turn-helix transcriptional regulator [Chimaeribacter californicus]PLR40864.1 XRE family transcriptional regulator [Chimaeribacter californicus]
MSDFGKNLANLRKQRTLTQLELANLLDVQPRMVGRWEQGASRPHFDYVVKLAQFFEVSIDYLVFGEQGQKLPAFEIRNKRLMELCKQVDALHKEDQEVICHFLELAIKQNRST